MRFAGFAIETRYASKNLMMAREVMAVSYYATMNKMTVKVIPDPLKVPSDMIPCGTVKYCEKVLGKPVIPDYYPDFLQSHLYRKIWRTNTWPTVKGVFIKPADQHKRFNGFLTKGGWKGKKRGPYICSDPVKFLNEWRYYVSNGKVLAAEWYQGDEVNTPDAPELVIGIPEGYCGAMDFGILSTGEFALVETHPPYACGWYGKDHNRYAEWLCWGWQYIRRIHETFSG